MGRQPGLVDELVVVDALDGVPGDGLHNDESTMKEKNMKMILSAVIPEGSLRGDIPIVLNIISRVKQSSCSDHASFHE